MNIWTPDEDRRVRSARNNKLPFRMLQQENGKEITPNHYHIIYQAVPDFKRIYERQRDALEEIFRLGSMAEPNTEWLEDGRVRIETKLHGRPGYHWIELEVAGCIKRACRLRPIRPTVDLEPEEYLPVFTETHGI